MKVTLIADGKVNPIGINRERVRLSVKTDKAPCFDKVEYFIAGLLAGEQDHKETVTKLGGK